MSVDVDAPGSKHTERAEEILQDFAHNKFLQKSGLNQKSKPGNYTGLNVIKEKWMN